MTSSTAAGAGGDSGGESGDPSSPRFEPIEVGTLPPGVPATSDGEVPAASTAGFRVLNLNLCNSGVAPCYRRNNGRAVPEAQGVILDVAPDVVTLQEVCSSDIESALGPTMARRWPGSWVFWAFMPAFNRETPEPITCTDGRGVFGNAVIGRVPDGDWQGVEAVGGRYLTQHENGNLRSFLCVSAVGNYHACGTHLTHLSEATALTQCEELMSGVIPEVWKRWGYRPTVVGGDLNLRYRPNPSSSQRNVQDGVPAGWFRKGDHGNQNGECDNITHVMATDDFGFSGSENIILEYTDHPAWLVALDLVERPPSTAADP